MSPQPPKWTFKPYSVIKKDTMVIYIYIIFLVHGISLKKYGLSPQYATKVDSRQQTVDTRHQTIDSRQKTVDNRQQRVTVDIRQQTVDGRRKTVDSRQKTVDS